MNEDILDHLAALMAAYERAYPGDEGVMASALAAFAEEATCDRCRHVFTRMVGADCFQCAIVTVWASELWAAVEARYREAEGEGGQWPI